MRWEEKQLDELGFMGRGKSKHRPRDAVHLYDGPYQFIQTGDVKHASLYITDYSQTYSEAGLAQSKLWAKGTLCITIAANIAETAILGIDACFPDSIIGFIVDESKCDSRFIIAVFTCMDPIFWECDRLGRFFRGRDARAPGMHPTENRYKYKFDTIKQRYQQVSHGAAQDNLSLEKLLSFKLTVPAVQVQHRIGDTLSAYDSLIENNLRRMKLLEESARLLYREWFIRLRFPGHEHTRIVNGVPEGWRKGQVGDL